MVNDFTRGLAVCAIAFGAGSCATSKQSASIQRVDDLVTRVEAVHLEAELAKQAIYQSILCLRPVITPTEGDPAAYFDAYTAALATSDESAVKLQRTIQPMEQSARQVFAKWDQDLQTFANESIRERSRERMQETRARYDAVLSSVKAASTRHETLNAALQDIALFLAHDFNPAAIAAIEGEAIGLREQAQQLGQELDRCMRAAETYVKQSAPVGVAIQPAVEPTAPAGGGATVPESNEAGARGQKSTRTAPRR